MPKKSPLNVRVPDELASKVRADARRNKRSIDAVMTTILADFFNAWTVSERGKFYSHQPVKRAGAPQAVETEAAR